MLNELVLNFKGSDCELGGMGAGHLALVGIPPSIFSVQQRKSCSTHYDPTAKRERRRAS